MKIDKIAKKILYSLTQNARTFDSEIAKNVSRTKETVGYRIQRLEEEEIITKYLAWIDPTQLGYQSNKIYLKLANIPQRKETFIKEAKQDNRLFWIGVADGAWDVGLTYFVKTQKEFFELKNELFATYNDLILESHTATLVEVMVGPKHVLAQADDTFLRLFASTNTIELEDVEKDILRELMKNSRTPVTQIASNIDSTTDIVRSRIKKLEKNNIIAGYSIGINHQKIGMDFYKTFVYMKSFSLQQQQRFEEYCRKHTYITHLVKQISPWDVELEILAPNFKQYNQTIRELTQAFSECIQKTETAIMTHDEIWPAGATFLEEQ